MMFGPARQLRERFCETSLWAKLRQYAVFAGRHVVEKVLWLFYTAQEPSTPPWARRAIYAALGYFIMPLDAIPDAAPGVGFVDDLGVLTAAVAAVAIYITPRVKQKTAQKMTQWFGEPASEPTARPTRSSV